MGKHSSFLFISFIFTKATANISEQVHARCSTHYFIGNISFIPNNTQWDFFFMDKNQGSVEWFISIYLVIRISGGQQVWDPTS